MTRGLTARSFTASARPASIANRRARRGVRNAKTCGFLRPARRRKPTVSGLAGAAARALPAEAGRPPFIVVVDVGRNIELYAEFSRSGGNYTAFPDPKHFRIRLADLRRPDIRERLSTLWLDPMRLDPSRESARVTRQIADQLAALAKSLEAGGHGAEDVASFLMRALFTMFAEDVGLLPERGFNDLLDSLRQ